MAENIAMIAKILAGLAALAACAAHAATSVQLLTPQNVSIAGGETKTFSARFFDAAGHPAAGEAVQFANDTCGFFPNGQFTYGTTTDATGTASATFTPLIPAGITCWLIATDGATANFNVETYTLALGYPLASVPASASSAGTKPYTVNVTANFGAYHLYNVNVQGRVVGGTASATLSPATQSTGDAASATFTVTPDGRFGSYQLQFFFGGQTQTVDVNVGATAVQDMWWAGAAENGWGMSLVQHPSGVLFSVIYAYDASGSPTWYVMPGGTWNAAHTSITGPLYSPRGTPYTAYDATRFVPGNAVGTATIAFTDDNDASLDYTIGAVTGHKDIVRQPFGQNDFAFHSNVGDMWWGGMDQDGWGIGLLQQFGALFGVWYTYDASGAPTWFVMPNGSWSDVNTYTGRIYRTTGSPWLGQPYDPAMLTVTDVGPFTWHFGASGATFDYSINGGAGTMEVVRQPF